jgi:hypothetical protein
MNAISPIASVIVPAGLLLTLGGLLLTKAHEAAEAEEKRSLFFLESCKEARTLLAACVENHFLSEMFRHKIGYGDGHEKKPGAARSVVVPLRSGRGSWASVLPEIGRDAETGGLR